MPAYPIPDSGALDSWSNEFLMPNLLIESATKQKINHEFINSIMLRSVMPELAPPPQYIFGRSVNPIPTGEGRLSPPITTGTPNVFHLPASLSDKRD